MRQMSKMYQYSIGTARLTALTGDLHRGTRMDLDRFDSVWRNPCASVDDGFYPSSSCGEEQPELRDKGFFSQ